MSHDLHPPRQATRTAPLDAKRAKLADKTRPSVNDSLGRKCTEPLFDSCSVLVDVRTGLLRDGHADSCDFCHSHTRTFHQIDNFTNEPFTAPFLPTESRPPPLSSWPSRAGR